MCQGASLGSHATMKYICILDFTLYNYRNQSSSSAKAIAGIHAFIMFKYLYRGHILLEKCALLFLLLNYKKVVYIYYLNWSSQKYCEMNIIIIFAEEI